MADRGEVSLRWLFGSFWKASSPTAGDGLHACLSAAAAQGPGASFKVCRWTKAKHQHRRQHTVRSPGSPVGKAHLTGCSNRSNRSSGIHQNSSVWALAVLVVLTLLASSSQPGIFWWVESARQLFGRLPAAPGLSQNTAFNTKSYQSRERFLVWTFHNKKEYLPFLLFFVHLAAWTSGTKEAMIGDCAYNLLLLIAREWL